MTVGRWFGPGLLDRYGRVPMVRASGAVAFAGLAIAAVTVLRGAPAETAAEVSADTPAEASAEASAETLAEREPALV
jgi:hypothetical protein